MDGDPLRPGDGAPAEQEEHRVARARHVALGTLSCPACDAPVGLTEGPVAPTDDIGCPYCGHASVVRDFLSLATPGRPARVVVRVL